jgi:hypothetical protein
MVFRVVCFDCECPYTCIPLFETYPYKMPTIQLSHKIVISNSEEAKQYQLENSYDKYFKELDYQLETRGIDQDRAIPINVQFEINEVLNITYANEFKAIIDRVKPFTDLRDIALELESIRLVCRTFTKKASRQVLFIFLESKPMVVADSYGSTKVLKNPNTADGNPLLTVELDKSTVIVSIKE